jgi:hypothetical protein
MNGKIVSRSSNNIVQTFTLKSEVTIQTRLLNMLHKMSQKLN